MPLARVLCWRRDGRLLGKGELGADVLRYAAGRDLCAGIIACVPPFARGYCCICATLRRLTPDLGDIGVDVSEVEVIQSGAVECLNDAADEMLGAVELVADLGEFGADTIQTPTIAAMWAVHQQGHRHLGAVLSSTARAPSQAPAFNVR
jgi:hypothetical protein